eukprot:CAMPEP_0117677514 /NCGR_PEP_ID=MMETSP0804-20121206/16785_1 /TAXON_ID=1074897 /ORGANISM="Tetraselmis astigmatica, Strain CCMP880" /LENGTH=38 /DNA_ID= /DNA_START= /DNA_END= /DNA_ORIENTATION=
MTAKHLKLGQGREAESQELMAAPKGGKDHALYIAAGQP